MIWFNIKELENLLIEGKVSDKLAFNYLLIHLILLTLTGYLSDDGAFWAAWVHLVISLTAVIWGVLKTFQINQEGGNRDYFKRFITLSFVVGVRITVFSLGILFIVALVTTITELAGVSFGLSATLDELLQLTAYLIFTGTFYYMLLGSFKRINIADVGRSSKERV